MDSRSMATGEQRRWKLAPLIKIRLPSRREVVCFVSLPPSLLFTIYLSLSIGRAFDLELFLESNDRYRSFLTNKETNLSNFSFPSKVYPFRVTFRFSLAIRFSRNLRKYELYRGIWNPGIWNVSLKFRSLLRMLRIRLSPWMPKISGHSVSSCKEILKSINLQMYHSARTFYQTWLTWNIRR